MSEMSPLNITGFSNLDIPEDKQNSLMKENVNKKMRKEMHKMHGKLH
jgi:hypothetical protein